MVVYRTPDPTSVEVRRHEFCQVYNVLMVRHKTTVLGTFSDQNVGIVVHFNRVKLTKTVNTFDTKR